jgi:hypothetical protein
VISDDNTTGFKIQIMGWTVLNGNAVQVLLSVVQWHFTGEENARLVKDAYHMLLSNQLSVVVLLFIPPLDACN